MVGENTTFVCCGRTFLSKRAYAGHMVGKHAQRSINQEGLKFGRGWNRGIPGSNKGNPQPKTRWTMEYLQTHPEFKMKREQSRRKHEEKVAQIVREMRAEGERVFALSQYEKEAKQPDIIHFKNGKLVAIEVESEKTYKPSKETVERRYRRAHTKNGFFDDVEVIWFKEE